MRNPVVFLPGLMCDIRLFGPQLLEFGRDLVVASVPMVMGERVEELASNALDKLPQKFALVGTSLGGVVAMEILRRAPDRVTRVALISTYALAETPETAAAYEPWIMKLRAGQLDEAMAGLLPPDNLAQGAGRADALNELRAMCRNLGADVIVKQIKALQRRRDYQSVLRKCKVPGLVLCGAEDGLTPDKRHSFMAGLMPYGELAVIENAGHLPTIENPTATNAALKSWMGQPLILHARVPS